MPMHWILRLITILLGLTGTYSVFGLTFNLPESGDIVGEMQTTTVRNGESLGDVGRRFDVGVYEMIEANPKLDPWWPTVGAIAIVPTQFILPKAPRVGLILNLAEMRLYFFHPDKRLVTTHPLGIGKKGWVTPLGSTTVTRKRKDPPWHPPKSIHEEHIANKDPLPAVVPGGTPENPLGLYALYLGQGLGPGAFLIHGTNRPAGIGVRGTHGCIRLSPEDIESLFYKVPIGTPVRIVHEPFKVGWHQGHLYLEAHQPLTGEQYANSNNLSVLEKMIKDSIQDSHVVNWTSATLGAKTSNGYPVRID